MSIGDFFRRFLKPRATPDALGLTAASVSAVTGHPVGDLSLYVQAMKHRSLLRGRVEAGVESNERLEYLGDAILGFLTAEHLYRCYPDEDEGFLTRLRSKLVNGKALAARAREIGLGPLVLVSENLSVQSDGHPGSNILSDAFEALIGALYLDAGIDAARQFVERTVLAGVDLDQLMQREDNPKSLLLEFAQARGWPQPSYRVVSESGPSHERRFTVQVIVRDRPLGSGSAGSKKRAEQRAAAEALSRLRQEPAHQPSGS